MTVDASGSAGLAKEPVDDGTLDEPVGVGTFEDPVDEADLTSFETRRPMVAGAFAGIWALLVGLGLISCVVMLVWATAANVGDSAAAWRAVGLTWLGAHHTPMTISGRPVSLLPMGALLLGLLLNRRSGAWACRLVPFPTRTELAGIIGGAGLAYGVGAAVIAWLSADDSASVHPVLAFLVAGIVAVTGAAWGASRDLGLAGQVLDRASDATRRTLVAGLAVAVGLFAAGAALTTLSLLWHVRQVFRALVDLDTGVVGLAGLTLLGVLSLPTLAVWAMAVMGGPGFRFGDVGAITAFGGNVETVPALPILAAIPESMPRWAPLLLAIPVALGVLAGRIRWGRDLPTMVGALQASGGVAAVVGAIMAGLTLLSSGSLGGGRLSAVGPHVVLATAACVSLVVAGFLGQSARQALGLAWDIHRVDPPGDGPGPEPVGNAGQDPGEAVSQDPGDAVAAAATQGRVGSAAGTLSDRASALGSAAATRVLGMGSVVAGLFSGQHVRDVTVDLRDPAPLDLRGGSDPVDLRERDASGSDPTDPAGSGAGGPEQARQAGSAEVAATDPRNLDVGPAEGDAGSAEPAGAGSDAEPAESAGARPESESADGDPVAFDGGDTAHGDTTHRDTAQAPGFAAGPAAASPGPDPLVVRSTADDDTIELPIITARRDSEQPR